MTKKTAIIIGAGPAGLTAAYELLKQTDIIPVVIEMSNDVGGISKTVVYKNNRIDIGGHRFFSKSEKVMRWWQEIMPIQGCPAWDDIILKRNYPEIQKNKGVDPEKVDLVFLIRNRLSRIFFLRSFFDYPITIKWNTFKNLGFVRIMKIGTSYALAKMTPIKIEKSLEDFLINRFGKELYKIFFQDYTEKVWGVPCKKIPSDWGAQRIKGLSVFQTLKHAIKKIFTKNMNIYQKNVETSLIEKFLYPKLGPGQLWETVCEKIVNNGAVVYMNHEVIKINIKNNKILSVLIKNTLNGEEFTISPDFVISSMPVKELISSINQDIVPLEVKNIAKGLLYRDFITVGILANNLKLKNTNKKFKSINDIIPDNWIYIQEKEVKLGRVQIFNNWSPYLVEDRSKVWIGLEYFCNEGDILWSKKDDDFINFAISEIETIGMIDSRDVVDSVIIRTKKAYPAYFGTYNKFNEIRLFTDKIENLFLVGRNGMHRYNNADHSMLTAMVAVECIKNECTSKNVIWEVNTEDEYHEQK